MFSRPLIRTTQPRDILWNSSNNDLKLCKNLLQLKYMFKKNNPYELEQRFSFF